MAIDACDPAANQLGETPKVAKKFRLQDIIRPLHLQASIHFTPCVDARFATLVRLAVLRSRRLPPTTLPPTTVQEVIERRKVIC